MLMLTIRDSSSMSGPDAPGLVDLPTELMQQCMPPHSCSIRAVCHKLFNLQAIGYNSRSLRVQLSLDGATDGGDERARKTLELMRTSFPGLKKLAVDVKQVWAPPDALLAPHPIHGPAWLINLVDVTIANGAQVDSFIPQCVAAACPQLERLKLTDARCQQQQGQQEQWHPAHLPRLTKLVLDSCNIDMEPEAVQQQLQALPSLEDFQLTVDRSTQYSDRFRCKITELYWYASADAGLAVLRGSWPRLHTLAMYCRDFDDADMEVLVKEMPSLEVLTVYQFLLSLPYINPPPRLSSVIINWDDISWQSLQGLYHLVRSCRRRPTIHSDQDEAVCSLSQCGLNSTAEADLAMAASIASVLQQGGVMSNGSRSEYVVSFFITSQEPPHVQQVLHHLLPIFHNPQCMRLNGSIHVSTALLTAVGQLPSLKRFELSDDISDEDSSCTFEEGMWDGRMIALLPQVTHLSLRCHEATETRIIRLCCQAPRPIKVRVKPVDWTDEELLLAVLAAAEGRMADLKIEYAQ